MSRRAQLLNDPSLKEVGGDDDVIVQGDLHIENHVEKESPSKSRWLPKLLLTAAAFAAGGVPLAGKTVLQHVIEMIVPTQSMIDTDTTIGLGSIKELKK